MEEGLMLFNLFAPRSERPVAPPAPKPLFFRPRLEGYEDRVVPATLPLVITDVDLTDFAIVDGVLEASGEVTGTLAGLPFTTEITNFALQLVDDDPGTGVVECSVLDLELAPIHVGLLGLFVDTSPICLEITAIEGGGLLGDLLCGLAGGGPLDTGIPTIPTGDLLGDLVGGLVGVLNGVLGVDQAGPAQGGGSVCTGECEILELALGPLDLSLLGVNVSLDDCDDGPVQVCVSASAGEGLLGNLLCGLSGFPNLNLDIGEITQIVDQALDFLEDGVLSGRDRGQLTALVNQLKN
jgi:hypothetical protein